MKMSIALIMLVAFTGLASSAPAIQSPQNLAQAQAQAQAQAAYGYEQQAAGYAKPTPYDFGYEVKDEYGATQARQEQGDGSGAVKGTYGYTDPNGLFRQVDYIADEYGFRVNVKTNEPGTSNQSPADVVLVAEETPSTVYIQKVAGPVQQKVVLPAQPNRPLVGVGLSSPYYRPVQGLQTVQTQAHYPLTAQAHYPIATQAYHPIQTTSFHPVETHAIHQVATPVNIVSAAHHPQTHYYTPVTKVSKVVQTHASGPAIIKAPIGSALVRSYGPYYDH